MYYCQLHVYCLGRRQELFDTVRAIPPLEHFTHTFSKSDAPDPALAAQADVILADLRELDGEDAAGLLAAGEKTVLILLAEREQIPALEDRLEAAADLWVLPMSAAEISFRFRRLQALMKERADAWQTSHFLDAAIDSTPNLIWYKDKNGIHEKVNASFCETVGKTKAQVQGRGHAYIWDVEQDDPACIESERIVMESRETCVSEETIQTGGGTRLLTTYKSPLYDLNGSVMGTVGIAIDVTQERAYEQELIAKTQTLETLFTTMDCGIMCQIGRASCRERVSWYV